MHTLGVRIAYLGGGDCTPGTALVHLVTSRLDRVATVPEVRAEVDPTPAADFPRRHPGPLLVLTPQG